MTHLELQQLKFHGSSLKIGESLSAYPWWRVTISVLKIKWLIKNYLYGLADDFYDTVFIIFLVNVIVVWENHKYITLSAFGCK